MSESTRTALTSCHESAGARLVDFAGWLMPIQYSSIVQEHNATRTSVGLFDISHMGRLDFHGTQAAAFVERMVTRRVCELAPGLVRYALVCNDDGGILDDVLVYRNEDGSDTPVQLVVNASNRPKILSWLEQQKIDDEDVRWTDQTASSCMIAVQGPRALEICSDVLGDWDPGTLKYYTAQRTQINGLDGHVSRTGYTGEDGLELTVPRDAGPALWDALLSRSAAVGGVPCGLGARDTLRLEAAMPLYGHELSESTTPFDVGLGFAVQFSRHEFIGKAALENAKAAPNWRRIGLQINGKRPAREHYPVLQGGQKIGEVTSGTFSPTLRFPIAMATVQASDPVDVGTTLTVEARGTSVEATVAELPFYRREGS